MCFIVCVLLCVVLYIALHVYDVAALWRNKLNYNNIWKGMASGGCLYPAGLPVPRLFPPNLVRLRPYSAGKFSMLRVAVFLDWFWFCRYFGLLPFLMWVTHLIQRLSASFQSSLDMPSRFIFRIYARALSTDSKDDDILSKDIHS